MFSSFKTSTRLCSPILYTHCFRTKVRALGRWLSRRHQPCCCVRASPRSNGTILEYKKWQHMQHAKALAYSCWQMYDAQPTGLSPEYVEYGEAVDPHAVKSAKRVRAALVPSCGYSIAWHVRGLRVLCHGVTIHLSVCSFADFPERMLQRAATFQCLAANCVCDCVILVSQHMLNQLFRLATAIHCSYSLTELLICAPLTLPCFTDHTLLTG